MRENVKKQKIQKTNKYIVFDFFVILIFSWKTDKLDQKLTKSVGSRCLHDIKNFGEKIT